METLVRRQVMSVGQAEIARRTCKDESKISRLMNGDLALFAQLLALCGLKVVPAEWRCADPDKIESVLKWAKIGMDSVKSAEDLLFNDPE